MTCSVNYIHFFLKLLYELIIIELFPAQVMEIQKSAKEGNKDACTLLAKQLVQLRKQKNRTFAANSKISSVGFQNKNMGANIALTGAMATTTKTMGAMNKIMKPEGIASDMRAFQQANMKMEMTDEMSKLLEFYSLIAKFNMNLSV